MKSIAEIFGKFFPVKASNGEVGIEIETETLAGGDYPKDFFKTKENPNTGLIYYELPMSSWHGHKDGSLRNFGMEFVLATPLDFGEVPAALKEFKEGTKTVKFIPSPPSTSVHIHLNFSRKTLIEVGNFLTLWILFENVLVEFCGETRRSNLFALPCRVAEGVTDNIVRMFNMIDEGDYRGINLDPGSAKYGAVNVATLAHIGSIELRCFRGTVETEEIQAWVNILEELYKFCSQPGLIPPDIIQAYRNSELEFFHNVFPKNGHKLAYGLNLLSYIERNVWYASDIANSVEDWASLGDKIPTNKTTAKKKKTQDQPEIFTELQQMYTLPVSGAAVNAVIMDEMPQAPSPTLNTDWISFNNLEQPQAIFDDIEIEIEDDI